MAEGDSIAVQGGPRGASGGAAGERQTQLVLPHRGAAVLSFSAAGACCFALTVVAGLLIRTGTVTTEEPEGELLLIVGLIALVSHVTLSLVAWAMAANDLRLMAEGRMDSAGKAATVAGKVIAMIFVLVTAASAIAAAVLVMSGRAPFTLEAPLQEP